MIKTEFVLGLDKYRGDLIMRDGAIVFKHNEETGNYVVAEYKHRPSTSPKEEAQQPIEARDWEIVEVECYGGEIRRLVDGEYRIFDDGIGWTWEELSRMADTKIKSVRRNSDGVVFSIGDYLEYYQGPITSFEIEGKMMRVKCKPSLSCSITAAKKKSTTPPSSSKERIEVDSLNLHDNFLGNKVDTYWYQFCTNQVLDGTKFPAIKQAIESCLNDEGVRTDGKLTVPAEMAEEFRKSPWNKDYAHDKKYTEMELDNAVDKAKEEAFWAGRTNPDGFIIKTFLFKYPTFQDYLQSIQIKQQ